MRRGLSHAPGPRHGGGRGLLPDKLGFKVLWEWGSPAVHVGLQFGEVIVHLNQQPACPDGFWLYFQIDNLDDLFACYQSNGVELEDEPTTKPWGMREFAVRDLNGYSLRFGQFDPTAGEPVAVERVDMSAPIEKRLAAVMADLATHKNMTLGELLEETFLHSFEQTDGKDSVASPHTKRTHAFIQERKQAHNLNYETHASYRFRDS